MSLPTHPTINLSSGVVDILQLKNVHLMNCAISSDDGSALMEVPLHESGVENSYQARVVDNSKAVSPSRTCAVELRSLDSIFHELSKNPTFIKCDVEGHELSVIKGAAQIMRRYCPAWLIEVSGDPDMAGSAASEVFRRLREVKYRGYWFDGKRLRMRAWGDRPVNYFFLQPWHVKQMQCSGMEVTN